MKNIFSLILIAIFLYSSAQDNRSVILQDLEKNQAANQNVTSISHTEISEPPFRR